MGKQKKTLSQHSCFVFELARRCKEKTKKSELRTRGSLCCSSTTSLPCKALTSDTAGRCCCWIDCVDWTSCKSDWSPRACPIQGAPSVTGANGTPSLVLLWQALEPHLLGVFSVVVCLELVKLDGWSKRKLSPRQH